MFVHYFAIHNNTVAYRLLKSTMPIIFVLLIWSYRKNLSNFIVWKKLGDMSYPIYLIHPFIGYILYYIFISLQLNYSIFWAVLSQILIVQISYYLSIILYKLPNIRSFILPKNISEIKNIFSQKQNKIENNIHQ